MKKNQVAKLAKTAVRGPKVTSPKGTRNWRDKVWSFLVGVATLVATAAFQSYEFIVHLLAIAADDLSKAFKSIDVSDRWWVGIVTSLVIGLLVLNKRKNAPPEEDT